MRIENKPFQDYSVTQSTLNLLKVNFFKKINHVFIQNVVGLLSFEDKETYSSYLPSKFVESVFHLQTSFNTFYYGTSCTTSLWFFL
jgi:hypothetical protein